MSSLPDRSKSLVNRWVNWFFASRWRFIITLFIILAIPVTITVFIIEYQLGRTLEKRVVNRNNRLTAVKAKLVREHMGGLKKYAETTLLDKEFIKLLAERAPRKKVIPHLRDIVTNHKMIDMAFMTDTAGTLIYDYPVDTTVYGKNFAYRDWYKGVAKNDSIYISEIYQRSALEKPFVVTIVTPVYDPSTREKVGYFGIQHPIQRLLEFLRNANPRQHSQMMLIDHRDNIPVEKRPGGEFLIRKVSDFPDFRKFNRDKRGAMKMNHPLYGDRCLVSYSEVPPMGWRVFTSYPLSKIHGPIDVLEGFIAGLVILCFLIILGAGLLWFEVIRQYHREREAHQFEISTLNQQLEEKVETLEAANEDLKTFTYSVSHDLQAPLRAIAGYSKIVIEEYKDVMDQELQELMEVIRENTQRMKNLIKDLLEFSRLGRQTTEKEAVNMTNIVKQVVEEQREIAGNGVDITIHELPATRGDPKLLRQVWNNLVTNAIKYSSKEEHPEIEIGVQKKEGRDVYYISDNGTGFDMENTEKMFQIFKRLHGQKEYEGTGVGLALVKRVIDKHGGEVWAESESGKGATFYFSLD